MLASIRFIIMLYFTIKMAEAKTNIEEVGCQVCSSV